LLKTFVTFLMATPSPFWPLVAALQDCQLLPMAMLLVYVPHDTVSALSQLFCDGVSIINNEILIEDLKDFTATKVAHGDSLRRKEGIDQAQGEVKDCTVGSVQFEEDGVSDSGGKGFWATGGCG
jgi:hypothetical protein